MKVSIRTLDKYLYQKLYLELIEGGFSVVEADADIAVCDIDTVRRQNGAVTLSKNEGADLRLPLRLGELSEYLGRDSSVKLSFDKSEKTVTLSGEKIKLTELEAELFSVLYEAQGFVSREEILSSVWGEGKEMGIVSVYIHYLRAKLERQGEKLIVSSRKGGYAIAEKYRKGQG